MPQQLRQVDSLPPENSQGQLLGIGQVTKPLPRLPRGWSRVCHETGLFLRSIGLGILVTAFHGFFSNDFLEPEKVAIRQSRVTALLRALIHVLPVGLAIFETTLNWRGYYVGDAFDKQNYLQFAAKLHEIFMQASIATIILSYIRYQISVGKGMPFGAVLGALQFFQVSYLWSVEFWSAIMSRDFPLRKKICFAILILSCITVAATAGPSSANLLIARQGIWPMKSQYLAINATFQDIWPNRLDDGKLSSECELELPMRSDDPHDCPFSRIYESISSNGIPTELQDYTGSVLQLLGWNGPDPEYAKTLLIASCFDGFKDQVCSSVPHDPFLTGLIEDSEALDHQEIDKAEQVYHTLKENYYQPYTTGSCVTDTVQNSSDQAPLRFVRLSETTSEFEKGRNSFPVPGLSKGQSTYNIPGNSSHFRMDWVDLPKEIFGTGVPGAIIVHPQSLSSLSYNITTCTLNAGWGSSSIFTDSLQDASILSHMTQLLPSWPDLEVTTSDAFGNLFTEKPLFRNASNFHYPQLRIDISKSWMKFLNPTFVREDNSTINFLSTIFEAVSSQPTEYELAWILNVLLAGGLSTTGTEYDAKVFEERAHASKSCKDCLVFEIENSIYGWRYTSQEITTKLAIAVMLTYCILVLAHLIYSAISGVSSTAWDSVAEMIALAMNSSPTEALQNTCAGIVGKTAYQTHVRVLKKGEKHLELVFGEVQDPNADISKLVMNEKYGSIAKAREDEDQ